MNLKPVRWLGTSRDEKNPMKEDGVKHETPADGNIFEDLGFGPEEAESLMLKSTLMIELRRHINDQALSQQEAATLLGVTQSQITNLLRGKIDHFSIEGLVEMLARAGLRVKVDFEKKVA